MSQVELPQLSLQRYVDLVRRRRWQLLPVSLLGLLVGGVIAFLIPRYFVAETLLVHNRVSDEPARPGEEDPMRAIVDSAKQTIPQAVPEAMAKLKWPELNVADPFEKTQRIKEVQSRLSVIDTNAERDRRYAEIRVYYKDQDGARSATFLNTLVEQWIEKRVRELREPEEAARKAAAEQVRRWTELRQDYQNERREILTKYGLNPDARSPSAQQMLIGVEQQKQLLLRDTLRAKDVLHGQLETRLARVREEFAATQERVPVDLQLLTEEAKKRPEVQGAFLRVQMSQLALTFWEDGSPGWIAKKRQLELAEGVLKASLAQAGDPDGTVANPKWLELKKAIADDEKALAELDVELARLRADVAADEARIKKLIDGYPLLDANDLAVADAERERDAAMTTMTRHADQLAKLTTQLPVTQAQVANPPPRPTDPNILVVALIGCVLGLGFAIGGILLLDFLQGSYKTVDDVERGLPVPVLGGISHLETEDERLTARAGRRRASVAAFGFVALVTVVVTIFYVDPTRLPPVVRDLLAMLLGS